jgi:hypothetical protein
MTIIGIINWKVNKFFSAYTSKYSIIYNIDDVPREASEKLIIISNKDDVPREASEKLIIITNKVRHLLWFDISLQVLPFTAETSMTSVEVWIFHCIMSRTSNDHYSFQISEEEEEEKEERNFKFNRGWF